MTAARPAFSALVFALSCLAASTLWARATESSQTPQEPPLSFSTFEEAIEGRARLTLAAEADPRFFRILLNSAKRAMSLAREDAENAHAVSLNDGADFERWSFETRDETRLVDARAISLLRRFTEYDGGARIRARLESFVFDREAGELLSLSDLFAEELSAESPAMEILRKAAIDQIAPVKAARLRISEAEAREALDSGLPLDARALKIFSFAPSTEPGRIGGLGFHFGQDELGAGEEGEYEALIPQEAFHEFLAEDWRAAFAGEPLALTRLSSLEGRSGAIYGLSPGESVAPPFTLRGEAPRAFFLEGAPRLEIAPENGASLLATVRAKTPPEAEPSGAVEEGVVFEAVFTEFKPVRAGTPLTLRLTAAARPDEAAAEEPDRMSFSLTAGEVSPPEASRPEPAAAP